MAYVGTPSAYRDARTTLASILQGEAGGNARGQQAVANVIQNRAAANLGGYGRSIMQQALAPNQFQGQVPIGRIGASAYNIADRALAGTLPNVVPDAMNYAARAGTTARWALSSLNRGLGVNIGGNNFWRNSRGDAPTYLPENFIGEQAGGGGGPLPTLASNRAGGLNVEMVNPDGSPASGSGFKTSLGFFDPSKDAGGGAVPNGAVEGLRPIGPKGQPPSANFDENGPIGKATGAIGSNTPAPWELFGVPATKYAGDKSLEGSKIEGEKAVEAAKKVAEATDKAAQSRTKDTTNQIASDTGLVASIESALTDLLVRGGLVALAFILILGAWIFYHSEQGRRFADATS